MRLKCAGTHQDLASHHVELREGAVLMLYDEDADSTGRPEQLLVRGVVEYSSSEQVWVAAVDWAAVRRASRTLIEQPGVTDPATQLPSSSPAMSPTAPLGRPPA